MLFMVVEDFRNRDRKAIYRRFRDKGRMAPEGLQVVNGAAGPLSSRAECVQPRGDS